MAFAFPNFEWQEQDVGKPWSTQQSDVLVMLNQLVYIDWLN